MVQLRPQFGHIDALHESDKSVWRQERAFEERAATRPEANEAQAVNMAVKSAENNDELDMYGAMSSTAKLLKDMRDEPWQRLQWIDQEVSTLTLLNLSKSLTIYRRMSPIRFTTKVLSTRIQKMPPN